MSHGLKNINENKLTIENILLTLRAFKSIELISSGLTHLLHLVYNHLALALTKLKIKHNSFCKNRKLYLSINSLFFKKNNQFF